MTARGARIPEELETLLEDAFVLRDAEALVQLFEARALLVVAGDLQEARGHQEIGGVAARMWELGHVYVADPRRVLQVGDTALVVAAGAVNVVRRGDEGTWRYAIAFLETQEELGAKR